MSFEQLAKKTNGPCVSYPMTRGPGDPDRLLTRSSFINQVNEATKLNTRLIESILGGDIANMERLMKMGANPNATCRLTHVTACHIAAMHDNIALDLLLRAGADSFRSDKAGRTPLHFAAWAGNAKQITLLLNPPEVGRRVSLEARGQREIMTVEIANVDHDVMMWHTIPQNNLDPTLSVCWCDELEHNCMNVHAYIEQLMPHQQRWTALHAASARAQHYCVQLLLAAAGSDVNAQDLLCRTPLDVAGCAHYMGHKIDVNNLMETVDLLLKAGGKFLKYSSENHSLDTPLHTAVELESEAAVEQMLQGGASAKFWNSKGLTAMHVCVKKRNKELLQLLVNHKCSNEDPHLATVDVRNRSGFTVLGSAIKADWIQGVCIAIGAGASIISKVYKESPFHAAAQLGNIDILEKILSIAKNSNINYCNLVEEAEVFEAIIHNHLDVLKLLLKHGSNIEVEASDGSNVLHYATRYGRKEILEYLLKYDSNITKRLINRSESSGPPLRWAIAKDHPNCADLLISEGAQVNAEYSKFGSSTHTTLLHEAAVRNHCEIAKMIIKKDNTTIHASVNELGWTPLYAACKYGRKEMIELLLRNGADLSGGENVNESNYFAKQRKCVPIELLMGSVSKPTEYLEEIFDSYIITEDRPESIAVEVDHRILLPKPGMKYMSVIKALINTGNRYDQHRLLLHPLVQSFLYPKWRSLLSFFYIIMVLHVCFVLSLNVFALSLFFYKDRKIEPVPLIFRSSVWIYIIYSTACLLTIQEIIVINMKSLKRYLLCLETLVKWLSTTLAVFLPQILSWESKPNPEWVRLFGSVTLLLSWVRMMFLLSRLPGYGYYVLMYGKVATKVFKILVSFGFVIFGFSMSFMIQFHAKQPFEGPWSSLLMTMVMMTSEFGYNEVINEKIVEHASASLIMKRLIFVSFLILVSIILMNLLVGVAVNDVNNLEMIGNINRLEKQVQFITSFEDIGCNNFIKKIFPTRLYERWFETIEWNKKFTLLDTHPYYECSHGNHLSAQLREAIFEKADTKKKQLEGKRGTMLYQMKLDEIHKVIVKKDGSEPPQSQGPDNALMMKLDEIHKVIIKNDSAEPTTTERFAALDTAMHKILEEILKLRNKIETN